MNNNIEILSPALMQALQRNGNTEISVKHYNEKLWMIHNRSLGMRYRVSFNQFEKDIVGTSAYDDLQNTFKEMLGKQSGMIIKTSLILASIPDTVDCILIEGEAIHDDSVRTISY